MHDGGKQQNGPDGEDARLIEQMRRDSIEGVWHAFAMLQEARSAKIRAESMVEHSQPVEARQRAILSRLLQPQPVRIERAEPEYVSEPIAARSSEGALFELLASIGCRLPTER